MRHLFFSVFLLIPACGSAVAAIEEHAFENAEQEARYNYPGSARDSKAEVALGVEEQQDLESFLTLQPELGR